MNYRNYVRKAASTVGGAVAGLAALVSAGCGSTNSPPESTLQSGKHVYNNGRIGEEYTRVIATEDDGNLCIGRLIVAETADGVNGRRITDLTFPFTPKGEITVDGESYDITSNVDELRVELENGTTLDYSKEGLSVKIKGSTASHVFKTRGDIYRAVQSLETEGDDYGWSFV
ncbi:MAG: hypothetical protein AABY10_03180, partial [Nanoarchaeota archaeon]